MLSIEGRLRQILNRVNNQINSHTVIVQERQIFDLANRFKDRKETNAAIKQLNKSYPSQKYGRRENIVLAFVSLYGKLREANRIKDEAMIHRLTTTDLYQMWKMEPTSTFNLYKASTGINFLHAKIHTNQYGRWFQCGFKTTHDGNIKKYHVIERKLDQLQSHARTWYFCQFQN